MYVCVHNNCTRCLCQSNEVVTCNWCRMRCALNSGMEHKLLIGKKKASQIIICHSYSWSGFRPTTRNIGVNISILPDLMSDDAATWRTEWTFVTPLGATERVSSTVRTQWVTIRPMVDTRKLCIEQPLPSMKEYLWRGVRETEREGGREREV